MKKIKIELTEQELHGLYDILCMITDETMNIITFNNLEEDFNNIFYKIEKIAIPELHGNKR